MRVILNILWLILAGWWLALGHLVAAVLLAITIIGLPLAAGHIKLVPVSLSWCRCRSGRSAGRSCRLPTRALGAIEAVSVDPRR